MNTTTTRIVVVAGRENRHPFVIVFAVSALLTGVAMLLGGPQPASIAVLLSFAMLMVWSLGLCAVGVGFLVAACIRDDADSQLVEAWACLAGFLAIAAYVVAAVIHLGRDAFVMPIGVTSAYGIGCLVQMIRLVRKFCRRRRALLGP